ncbi:MAG: ethanolamine ammonia-lyase subunit EutC [Gammaproteobacteria bacterium]|nr:ethanolamine ammonia-lyase subunit EutC [Gammaproteobacteria bacterium]
MTTPPDQPNDSWAFLRRFTFARIALGHAGGSVPTQALLDFRLAHARARDAVYHAMDIDRLQQALQELALLQIRVNSLAENRTTYLQRPDLGRSLHPDSRQILTAANKTTDYDIVFMIGDGLSAIAVEQHATALLAATLPALHQQKWRIGPLILAEQARVALGDDVGKTLGTKLIVVIIGERPGLSSPDSMGIYLTWAPRPGRTDAERNCISNIRPQGLSMADAANKLLYLINQARRLRLSGIELKDETSSFLTVSKD